MNKTIKLNNKEYSMRINQKVIKEYFNEFKEYFSIEMFDYINKNTENERDLINDLKHVYFKGYEFKDFCCKICGEYIGHARKICDKKYCYSECRAVFRGVKRPEHSKKMKVKMNELSKQGKLDRTKAAKRINSREFYISGLIKHEYITKPESNELSDQEIKNLYSKLKSKRAKSFEFRESCIKNYIDKYIDENLVKEQLLPIKESINKNNINEYYSLYMSIKSTIAMRNNPNMGSQKNFKNIQMEDLKFCKNLDRLITRSSYEKNYIDYFEKNKIFYGYESESIKCKNSIYIPDFITDEYILEVKGSFYRFSPEGYFNKKLKFGIEYARSIGKSFFISFSPEFNRNKFINLTNVTKCKQFLEKIKEK
jgi:hypothetical protein